MLGGGGTVRFGSVDTVGLAGLTGVPSLGVPFVAMSRVEELASRHAFGKKTTDGGKASQASPYWAVPISSFGVALECRSGLTGKERRVVQ